MVSTIRNIELAMGNGIKAASESEQKNLNIVRRSLHLTSNLKKGHILSEKDLILKRPGDGISAVQIDLVLGKKIKLDLENDHKLFFNDFE